MTIWKYFGESEKSDERVGRECRREWGESEEREGREWEESGGREGESWERMGREWGGSWGRVERERRESRERVGRESGERVGRIGERVERECGECDILNIHCLSYRRPYLMCIKSRVYY